MYRYVLNLENKSENFFYDCELVHIEKTMESVK